MKSPTNAIQFALKGRMIVLSSAISKIFKYDVCHKQGFILKQGQFKSHTKVDITDLTKGFYEIVVFGEEFIFRISFCLN